MAALVDPYTNLITNNILIVLDYLFYNFGTVSLKEVLEKESKIMLMTWNPSDPIVLITRPLE